MNRDVIEAQIVDAYDRRIKYSPYDEAEAKAMYDKLHGKKAASTATTSLVLKKDMDEHEKMDLLDDARALVKVLEEDLEVYKPPHWKDATTWQYMRGEELKPGDGVQYNNIICIMVKRLAWWRNKCANILLQEHHNPAKQYRIGTEEFVYAFPGYVSHQQMSRMGIDMDDLGL